MEDIIACLEAISDVGNQTFCIHKLSSTIWQVKFMTNFMGKNSKFY